MTSGAVWDQAIGLLGLTEAMPTLRQNALDSRQTLDEATAWLVDSVPLDQAEGVDVIALGSYARGEASGKSDFDYLVIPHRLPTDIRVGRRLLEAADSFMESKGLPLPGKSGLFGQIIGAVDLTERIGLEQDTNLSHSRRMLLLEESTSLYRPELHERLRRSVVDRYLVDYELPKQGPPRFLTNDVIRYWYTLAVDYQAKRWENTSAGWGLRYLKLLNSRKLGHAGTIITLLRCSTTRPATSDYLVEQFELPALARVAQLALDDEFDQRDSLREVLVAAERFAAFLESDERQVVKEMKLADDPVPAFIEMRELSKTMSDHLRAVIFDSYLGPNAQKYLAF